jgi:hypothetical protein
MVALSTPLATPTVGSGSAPSVTKKSLQPLDNDDAHIRVSRSQTSHQIEEVLYVAVAKKHQVDFR